MAFKGIIRSLHRDRCRIQQDSRASSISPDCTKLRTLLLQENENLCEISSTFFKKMNSLRLLDLSGTRASSLPLPYRSLLQLRVLNLDRCHFTKTPNIGSLRMLAILSLRESKIEELPDGLRNLRNLRILDLTMSMELRRIPSAVLSGLEYLEELYMKGSFAEWRDGEMGSASFAELLNLPRLTVLEVDIINSPSPSIDIWQPRVLRDKINLSRLKFDICVCRIRKTRLESAAQRTGVPTLLLDTSLDKLPSWFSDLSKKAEKLSYVHSRGVDMFTEQSGGRLVNLKSLTLGNLSLTPCIFKNRGTEAPAVFDCLRELHIQDSGIMEICDKELPEETFKNLEFLSVTQCVFLNGSSSHSLFFLNW